MKCLRGKGSFGVVRIAAVFCVGFLSACQQRLAEPGELVEPAPAFSVEGIAEIDEAWWECFEDEELNALVKRSLQNSPDLRSVYERFVAAQALARRERSGLFPSLSFEGGGTSRHSDFVSSDFFDSGLSASYELDLWGQVSANASAADLRAVSSAHDYELAALSLSGEVAAAWYRYIGEQLLLEEIEFQIDANCALVESLLNRFRNSEADSVDVLRQERLLESTREQAIRSQREIRLLRNQILLLSGQSLPSELPEYELLLPELGEMPTLGLPADLILRRPDLRGAYVELQAADRDLAVAIRNRFPQIRLSASLVTSTQDPSSYAENWTRSILGDIVGPLVDGGSRRAEVSRNEAVRRQLTADFEQACLVAFREVEDALIRESTDAQLRKSIERQIELQEKALSQIQREFFNGVVNFIDVLSAVTEAQQLRRDLISTRVGQIENRIALHRAISGPIPNQTNRPLEKTYE